MKRVLFTSAMAFAVMASVAVPAYSAQEAAGGPPVLAKDIAPARAGSRILVTSTEFRAGGDLPDKYTQNGANVSPPLSWTKGPTGTASYAVFVEDSGVNRADPVVHRVLYDLPGTTTSLSTGVPATPMLEDGGMQAKNARGMTGYLGPKPPAGQTHPYHFQVFALSTKLHLDPATTDRKAVAEAMKGKVLALGDLTVNYAGK